MKARILWALGISVFLIVIYAFVFFFGFYVGVMGTDSCKGVEGYAIVYLAFVWPAILLTAALLPGALLVANRSAGLIVASAIIGGILGVLLYLIYPLLLQTACKPMFSS